jgi:SAM-dependent methyltransferase
MTPKSAVTPWHDNDELWAELLPLLCEEGLVKAAKTEARQAAALLGVEPGARVLDLGCGPGRHSLELARLGYRVTGVDRTVSYLAHARQRAAEAGLDIEWVQASMLEFQRQAAFDGALNILTSFGYFADRGADLRVLGNIRESLKPGARLLIDIASKEIISRSYVTRHWQETRPGRFWLIERQVVPGWGKLRVRWLFVGAGEAKEFVFEHQLYSAMELAQLMEQAGFAEIGIYGDLDARPYDHAATRLVLVGRRQLN